MTRGDSMTFLTTGTASKNDLDRSDVPDLYSYALSEDGREFGYNVFEYLNMASPSIEAGSDLVRKLLVQISLNDSPPSNNDKQQSHKQRGATLDPGQFLSPAFSLSNICLKQQGQVSLAKLCEHTLDGLGKTPERAPRTENSTLSILKENRQNKMNIPSNKKAHALQWKTKTKNSRRSLTGSPKKSRIFDGDSSEGRDVSETLQDNQESARLQLFGSEYARYLSTTPLAPKNSHIQPPKRVNSRGARKNETRNIEDADSRVLTGPITDIIIIEGDKAPPKGYYRISQSPSGVPFFFGTKKTPLFFYVKKERNWDRAAQRPCVTAVSIIFPDRKEFVPPGFSLVCSSQPDPSSSKRLPINLNEGGNEPAYLCFRRSREGNPLTGIIPLFPASRDLVPEGYTVLERTPRNFVASVCAPSTPIFLAYRQRLANLEMLRPAPFVKSVLNGDSNDTRLESYYCTGGTVVSSRVGRFHIMDRSTHSLLSPSSINHRLALIEMSRRKTLSSIEEYSKIVREKYSYSETSTGGTISSSDLLLRGLDSSESRADSDRQSSIGDYESVAYSSDVNSSIASSSQHSRSNSGISGIHDEVTPRRLVSRNERNDLERCIETLSFIPTISSRTQESPKDNAIFKARVSILVPILTSCYTRHGGSAFLSIAGLIDLLRQDFYEDDIEMSRDPSSRTTLLDLSIQVVCDVATMGAQETHFYTCVEFVEEAVKYGCGYLSTRTLGYVHRFFLFVFYFGISSPAGNWGVISASDRYLLEDTRFQTTKVVLPGGAPQSAILSLKDLIIFMIARLGSQVHFDQSHSKNTTNNERAEIRCPHFSLIDNMVAQAVDQSVFRVDMANFTELAMHQIMRSGGSELFWYEMINLCDSSLFGNDIVLREETRHMYAICFAFLANCVKTALSKVRRRFPRDVANKLMSLEMLKFFLEKWERGLDAQEIQGSHSILSFAFCIRRLVVPCLLKNTSDCLADPRIFRRLIQIIGVLWCSPFYRKHMKLEIGILFDHFILRLLKLGPQILFKTNDSKDTTYVFAQQLELMKEIKNWFSVDADKFLELYLNYDTEHGTQKIRGSRDLLPGLQWNIAEQLCSFLCNLSEECTEFLGDKIKESHLSSPTSKSTKVDSKSNQGYEGMSIATLARESARRLRHVALDAISQIVKALSMSTSTSLGEDFSTIVEAWYNGQKYVAKKRTLTREVDNSRPDSALVVDYWHKMGIAKNLTNESIYSESDSTLDSHVDISERKKNINVAFSISREKGLAKAIEYLIACNVLTASPREISSFLRIHSKDLDPAALGRYLGEGGSDHSETDFWNQLRFSFIRATSFVRMTIEEGLRHLLTEGGFRLPGEAQQIDRIISTFARCYWEDNVGDEDNCPIENQDSIYLLSFAIIILNTDLHKSKHSSTKKKNPFKKMTKDEFIANLQRASKDIKMDEEYLSTIYDGIEANPIVLRSGIDEVANSNEVNRSENLELCIHRMTGNVKSLDALLRGLATNEYRYTSLQDYCSSFDDSKETTTISLARSFMTKSWHHFHGLINSTLKIAHLDPKAMESCVDLLKFSLCLTILLDMPTEQAAFLNQLGRFRLFNAWRIGKSADTALSSSFHDQESYRKERWYIKMKQSSQSSSNSISAKNYDEKLESLELLDRVVNDMGLTSVSTNFEEAKRRLLREVTRKIENAEFLLNDPTRTFLREGSIMKRANRSGRDVEYRFFLFSDLLIYAKKVKASPSGSSQSQTIYRIHEELPLILMKVVDWFPPKMKKEESKRAIQIYHPRKIFLVLCRDNEERKSWVTDIRQAIDKELERKVAIETARKAAANVPVNGSARTSSDPISFSQCKKSLP